MHQINQKCTKPLAYWTMLQEYRGLSRQGREINSAVDASLPLTTYDTFKKAERKRYTEKIDESLALNFGILISDNYSHVYAGTGMSLERGVPYVPCNWTVNAVQMF